jgi:hypothetical protein
MVELRCSETVLAGRECTLYKARLVASDTRSYFTITERVIDWDKKAENYLGLLKLACGLLWFRRYSRLAPMR